MSLDGRPWHRRLEALHDCDKTLRIEPLAGIAEFRERPPAVRGHSLCLTVTRTARTDYGRYDAPKQMPFVLVEALAAPCESSAPSQHDRPKLGHVEADLLDEFPARRLLR